MRAITRVETGRSLTGRTADPTPWPWTVNAGGQGYWLDTKADAIRLAKTRHAAGDTQIDLGCFQLNLKWHGRAFASFADMMDPARNARYAARFLASLKAELGDWTSASAAYHSRTPARGQAYLRRILAILETQRPGGLRPAQAPHTAARRPVSITSPHSDRGPTERAAGGAALLGSLVTLAPRTGGAAAASGALAWRDRP
jgi:hypothetical protein